MAEINHFTFGGAKRISQWDSNKVEEAKKHLDLWFKMTDLTVDQFLEILHGISKKYSPEESPAGAIFKLWKKRKVIELKHRKEAQ